MCSPKLSPLGGNDQPHPESNLNVHILFDSAKEVSHKIAEMHLCGVLWHREVHP